MMTHRVVAELSGDNKLGGHWRWCLVHWTNVCNGEHDGDGDDKANGSGDYMFQAN